MENQMPFNEAMFTLASGWQTVWLYWMSFAIIVTPLEQIGYVRLLGIVHVILWTPLFIYLFLRAKNGEMPLLCRLIIWMFVATLAVSLVFDYSDVVRYLLGERDSMI
jgi:hypothetical protein